MPTGGLLLSIFRDTARKFLGHKTEQTIIITVDCRCLC